MNLCEKNGVSANVHRVFCLVESDMFFAEVKKDFFRVRKSAVFLLLRWKNGGEFGGRKKRTNGELF